uniref:Uncharacterized protein n=1 Tax=Chelonoidis abingdonii TaxID=106734 RepID=A0A8C0JEG2_CHEAB
MSLFPIVRAGSRPQSAKHALGTACRGGRSAGCWEGSRQLWWTSHRRACGGSGSPTAKKAAVMAKGKWFSKEEMKGLEMYKDPMLLTTHTMGLNFHRQGPEVAPKDAPLKKLEKLDPETPQYWRLLWKHNTWCHSKLSKSKKF